MERVIHINYHQERLNFIDNNPIQEVIDFAKAYNIFQSGGTKIYKDVCDKIKQRLDREGLTYETVRPD